MSDATVFEVEVPASRVALADAFERAPNVAFRMDRVVGGVRERVMPFVWVSGVDSESAPELLKSDRSVTDVRPLGGDGDERLFEVTFDDGICRFAETIFQRGGVVMRASGEDGVWTFQLRFADHTDIGNVFDDAFCRRYEATVTRLYSDQRSATSGTALTHKQRQAVAAAYELDYYTVPRSADLEEVGERLDVSRQAVSERLRRAHASLIGDYLGETRPE